LIETRRLIDRYGQCRTAWSALKRLQFWKAAKSRCYPGKLHRLAATWAMRGFGVDVCCGLFSKRIHNYRAV
jgi:hypothetical protein